jgi:hypothetical protein
MYMNTKYTITFVMQQELRAVLHTSYDFYDHIPPIGSVDVLLFHRISTDGCVAFVTIFYDESEIKASTIGIPCNGHQISTSNIFYIAYPKG